MLVCVVGVGVGAMCQVSMSSARGFEVGLLVAQQGQVQEKANQQKPSRGIVDAERPLIFPRDLSSSTSILFFSAT